MEKRSAIFGACHEEQIPADADHSAICKFETDSDDTFEKIYKRIRRMRINPRGIVYAAPSQNTELSRTGRLDFKAPLAPPRYRQDFEIAIICALPLEADAVMALFDKDWIDEGRTYGKAPGDPNAYTAGAIGEHNVVVAHMPGMGKVNAASVAAGLRVSFENIKLALVVGICGGMPYNPQRQEKIYLGDVIISQNLIQYDFGRQYPKGFQRKDTLEDSLSRPGMEVRAALAKLTTDYHHRRLRESTNRYLKELQRVMNKAVYPKAVFDKLFEASHLHKHRDPTVCVECVDGNEAQICEIAQKATCDDLGCHKHDLCKHDPPFTYRRRLDCESEMNPPCAIHIGKMGSGDTVMKSGQRRDQVASANGIIAFEMEGAGVWDYFPSLVIKGVCDYADSHKNKLWQNYAAATAASCMKAVLKDWEIGT